MSEEEKYYYDQSEMVGAIRIMRQLAVYFKSVDKDKWTNDEIHRFLNKEALRWSEDWLARYYPPPKPKEKKMVEPCQRLILC